MPCTDQVESNNRGPGAMLRDQRVLEPIICGAAGGLVGTFALQAAHMGSEKLFGDAEPPMREEPGEFMVKTAEQALPEAARSRIPETAEQVAAHGLGFAYGVTFGALYGLLDRRDSSVLVDGAALGLGCWAAGYLGWLPAAGLMPPVWEHKPKQVVAPIMEHILYGIAAVATFRLLREII